MEIGAELAVQSFCFRNFKDNAKTAELVKACGLARIEICAAHVDFQNPGGFAEAIEAYRAGGVEIISTGVNGIGACQAARNLFEFSKAAGTKFMSVDFPLENVAECLRTAEKLADEYDLLLGIHNHGGRHWLGSTQALDWVFANSSERIGLCLDTAWALHSHEDPIAMAEKFGKRLYGVHIKDFTFDRAGRHEDVIVGTGNLDLNGLAAAMAAADFDGYVVLEYEGDAADPVPALVECVKAVRGAMQGVQQ